MRTDTVQPASVLATLAVCVLIPTHALAQHVHGVMDLGVVVEGNSVAVSLTAPLSDVVGFEHAPSEEAQRELIATAAALLADPNAMFGLSGGQGCEATSVSVEGPDYWSSDSQESNSDDHDDDHEEHDHHDDEHHDHDDHDHDNHDDEHGEHNEIVASYEWQCSGSAPDALELRFIDGFSGVEEIQVQVLTDDGASVTTAGPETESISLIGQ